jgi:hypothetical protein
MVGTMTASLPLAAINTSQNPTHLLGPHNPPLVDTPGNGVPSPGTDTTIGLSRTNDTVTITSPWTCNPSSVKNQITLSNPDMQGRFRTASRFSENLNKTQQVTVTGYDTNGEPTQFLFEELSGKTPGRTGMGTLISSHNDGVYDTLELQQVGGGVLATLSLEDFNTGGGSTPNYVSIPWAQTATLGGKTACNGSNPQVFLPVASNGRIVFDLDGNGVPDPDVYESPVIVSSSIAAVPTLAPVGLTLLAAALLLGAIRLLRRESAPAGWPQA